MTAHKGILIEDPIFRSLEPVVETRPDGSISLSTSHPLGDYARCLTERVRHWAQVAPERACLAQREAGDWRVMSYAEVEQAMRRLGASILARQLSADRPVLILSGNDLPHALIALACMDVGVPYCPISTAYSLVSQDFGKLRSAVELMTPGLVYATQGHAFARAIKAVVPAGVEVVVGDGTHAALGATDLAKLLETPISPEADAAHAAVTGDTIAKFLLTSGSTGLPKAVINTQRMLCANQAMIRETMVFLKSEPPVILDWLPWSHTFGSNHNFGIALCNGGTFYIDDGKPMPGGVEATARNLREVMPTIYFNVPKGYEALLPFLRSDRELRECLFSRLKFLFYAGAGLSKPVWDELKTLSAETTGRAIRIVTSLGSTETAPDSLFCGHDVDGPGIVGLPLPGVELKLVPTDGKLAAWLRGDHIMPGYWRRDDLTQTAFDEDGFYNLGDALKPALPGDFSDGLVFDGRISEDFKLATGTWVCVGPLQAKVVAHLAPLVKDVVIAGHDRDDICIIIFPDIDACRKLATAVPESAAVETVLADAGVRAAFREGLASLAAAAMGSSTRVVRAILLAEPPSIDLGEATAKGSLNQRAVLQHRAGLVEDLYSPVPSAHVITLRPQTRA